MIDSGKKPMIHTVCANSAATGITPERLHMATDRNVRSRKVPIMTHPFRCATRLLLGVRAVVSVVLGSRRRRLRAEPTQVCHRDKYATVTEGLHTLDNPYARCLNGEHTSAHANTSPL